MRYSDTPCHAQPIGSSVRVILVRCIANMDSKSEQKACIMDAFLDGIFSEEETQMLIQSMNLANA